MAESWSVVCACVPLFLLLFGAWFWLAGKLKSGFSKLDCGRCFFSPKTGDCSGSFDHVRRVATTLYALLPLTFIGSFVLAIYVVASVLPYGDESVRSIYDPLATALFFASWAACVAVCLKGRRFWFFEAFCCRCALKRFPSNKVVDIECMCVHCASLARAEEARCLQLVQDEAARVRAEEARAERLAREEQARWKPPADLSYPPLEKVTFGAPLTLKPALGTAGVPTTAYKALSAGLGVTAQLETLFDSVSGGKSGGSSVASCVSLEQKLEAVKGFRGVEERGRALQGAAAKVVAALQHVVRAGDVSVALRTCNVSVLEDEMVASKAKESATAAQKALAHQTEIAGMEKQKAAASAREDYDEAKAIKTAQGKRREEMNQTEAQEAKLLNARQEKQQAEVSHFKAIAKMLEPCGPAITQIKEEVSRARIEAASMLDVAIRAVPEATNSLKHRVGNDLSKALHEAAHLQNLAGWTTGKEMALAANALAATGNQLSDRVVSAVSVLEAEASCAREATNTCFADVLAAVGVLEKALALDSPSKQQTAIRAWSSPSLTGKVAWMIDSLKTLCLEAGKAQQGVAALRRALAGDQVAALLGLVRSAPAIPPGLSLDSETGWITGKATLPGALYEFSVAAYNDLGEATCLLSFKIDHATPPANLAFAPPRFPSVSPAGSSNAAEALVVGKECSFSPLQGFLRGDPPAELSVSPPLPPGLRIDASGTISGTPNAAGAAVLHTVTAVNVQGACHCEIAFEVQFHARPSPPEYASLVWVCGQTFSETPTTTGTYLRFSVSPALPEGLKLSTTTGTISGVPATAAAQALYTVTAKNRVAHGSGKVDLEVQLHTPTSAPQYPEWLHTGRGQQAIFVCEMLLSPVRPETSGTYLKFSIEPPLPRGLNFDLENGTISGTPKEAAARSRHKVTVRNRIGASECEVAFEVQQHVIPTRLVYPEHLNPGKKLHHIFVRGETLDVHADTDGTHLVFDVKPPLPEGVELSGSSGAISFTTHASPAVLNEYQVTGTNRRGARTARVSFAIATPHGLTKPLEWSPDQVRLWLKEQLRMSDANLAHFAELDGATLKTLKAGGVDLLDSLFPKAPDDIRASLSHAIRGKDIEGRMALSKRVWEGTSKPGDKCAQDDLPTPLQKDYRAEVFLGAGAFGTVLRVSRVTDAEVISYTRAVKIVHNCGLPFSDKQKRRLVREANILSRVRSDNIVELFDYAMSPYDDVFWLIMKDLDGKSLDVLLAEGAVFSLKDVTKVGLDVAAALMELHKHGVLHRDIKPGNIVRSRLKGQSQAYAYKVVDLGISVATEETGASASIASMATTGGLKFAGTPAYMSPEAYQASSGDTTIQLSFTSDIFALGMTLWHLLVGKLPYPANPMALMMQISNLVIPVPDVRDHVPHHLRSSLSSAFCETLSKSLEKVAAKRIASAGEVFASLQAALVDQGEDTYSVFVSYRVWSEKVLARLLFEHLANTLTPAGHRVKPYLDQVRLLDGENWEEGFSHGLCNSRVMLPVFSLGSTGQIATNLKGREDDPKDNVLMEWELGMEMVEQAKAGGKGTLCAIFPLLVGSMSDNEGHPRMADYFAESSKQLPYAHAVSRKTKDAAIAFLEKQGLTPSTKMRSRTVDDTIQELLAIQGAALWRPETQGKPVHDGQRLFCDAFLKVRNRPLPLPASRLFFSLLGLGGFSSRFGCFSLLGLALPEPLGSCCF